ncbi:hypothetical protein ABW20_dc0108731 [Dactylellina cionopaga]|nr:hypothetical protein ABW20_dc0108731 [Dactylellina cionopaga]
MQPEPSEDFYTTLNSYLLSKDGSHSGITATTPTSPTFKETQANTTNGPLPHLGLIALECPHSHACPIGGPKSAFKQSYFYPMMAWGGREGCIKIHSKTLGGCVVSSSPLFASVEAEDIAAKGMLRNVVKKATVEGISTKVITIPYVHLPL